MDLRFQVLKKKRRRRNSVQACCVFFFRASGFWVGPGCWGLRGSVCSWGCSPWVRGLLSAALLGSGGPFNLGLLPACCLGFPWTPWALWAPRCFRPLPGCPPDMMQCSCDLPSYIQSQTFSHTHTCTHDNIVLCRPRDWFYYLCFCYCCAAADVIADVIALTVVLLLPRPPVVGTPASHLLIKSHSRSQIIPSSSHVNKVTAHRRPGSLFRICVVGLPQV